MKKVMVAQFWSVDLSHEILRGVEEYARMHEPWTVERTSARSEELETFDATGRDGAIVSMIHDRHAELCRRFHIPCVSTHGGNAFAEFPEVDVDNYAAGVLAADYFIGKGYDHPALLGNTLIAGHRQREQGFLDRMMREGPPPGCFHLEIYGASEERSMQMIHDQLDDFPRPAAIYCINDRVAYLLYVYCREQGLRIPEDIGILASSRHNKFRDKIDIDLSYLDLPYRDVGIRAAQMLDTLMRGRTPPESAVLFPPLSVIERNSTA